MQRIIFFLSLSLILLLAACSPDDPIGTLPGTGTISFKIDGEKFSYTVTAVIYNDNTLNVGALGVDEAQLQFNNVDSEGDFELNNAQGLIDVIFLTDGNDTQISAAEGNYSITKLTNNKAEGTFSCTAYAVTDFLLENPIEVTDGEFEANF